MKGGWHVLHLKDEEAEIPRAGNVFMITT
jgi:hypothetical protein